MAKNKKKAKKSEQIKSFEALLALPERLAQYLRLWFHLAKTDWDFTIDKIRQGNPYLEWSKSKGKGRGRRYFAAPCDELKKVQKSILNQFLSQIPVHFSRHGGVKGSSILTNADHHAGFAKTVFAVDIVDAFPSVFRSRVRACLRKPFEFGLRQFAGIEFNDKDKEKMLESIVDLLVLRDRLPQGPPTSPRIFEIVCGKMDQNLFQLVEKSSTAFQRYRLSIYADNITISSDSDIPEEFRTEVVRIIQEQGFHTHSRKDKMAYFSPETGTVPVVTGLVILGDGRVLMHPNKVNQLRGRLTKLLRQELWDGNQHGEISGIIGYIRQVYPIGKKLPSKIRKVVEQIEARMNKQAASVQTDAATTMTVVPTDEKKKKRKSSQKKNGNTQKGKNGSSSVTDVLLTAV